MKRLVKSTALILAAVLITTGCSMNVNEQTTSSNDINSEQTPVKVSSVTGDLNETVYSGITDFEDMEALSLLSKDTMGRPGRGGEGFEPRDGEMKEHPEGERPERKDDSKSEPENN